jgi:hypothetical protein
MLLGPMLLFLAPMEGLCGCSIDPDNDGHVTIEEGVKTVEKDAFRD